MTISFIPRQRFPCLLRVNNTYAYKWIAIKFFILIDDMIQKESTEVFLNCPHDLRLNEVFLHSVQL